MREEGGVGRPILFLAPAKRKKRKNKGNDDDYVVEHLTELSVSFPSRPVTAPPLHTSSRPRPKAQQRVCWMACVLFWQSAYTAGYEWCWTWLSLLDGVHILSSTASPCCPSTACTRNKSRPWRPAFSSPLHSICFICDSSPFFHFLTVFLMSISLCC